MKSFSPALAAYVASGQISVRLLLWLTARNRGTGVSETIGLWNGEDTRTFTIAGGSRTYFAAGALLSVDPVVSAVGLDVRMLAVRLSEVAPEVAQALKGYDARFAPVELHRAVFARETAELLEEPHRLWLGTVDSEEWSVAALPEDGSPAEATVTLTLASSARALTRTLATKKSDEAQKLRAGDRGRRYAAVAGRVEVWWGQRPRGSKDWKPPSSGGATVLAGSQRRDR